MSDPSPERPEAERQVYEMQILNTVRQIDSFDITFNLDISDGNEFRNAYRYTGLFQKDSTRLNITKEDISPSPNSPFTTHGHYVKVAHPADNDGERTVETFEIQYDSLRDNDDVIVHGSNHELMRAVRHVFYGPYDENGFMVPGKPASNYRNVDRFEDIISVTTQLRDILAHFQTAEHLPYPTPKSY